MNDVFPLVVALSALITLLIIRPPWRRRASAFGQRLLALRGRARAVDSAGFTLETKGSSHRVRLELGPTARLPREGSLVRVAGVAAQQQGGESHYRDAGITRFIDAVDVMFVRREQLLRAATVATLALCMMLSVRLYLRDRTPLGALVARTAAQIRCPNGTERVTVGGPPQLFMHYCRDPAGNKHGPYGVWNHDGRLRERGAYRRGVRTGPLIEIDPPLFNRNSCAINGQRKKRGDKCPLIARVSRLDSKGRAHGMAYGYFYPRRQRAYIGTFRSGRRVGAWTYYHPRGHQLYRIDYGKRGTEYAYRDERNGNWCPGNAQPAIAWQLSKPDQRCTITCTTIPIKGLAFTERGICADRGTGPKLSQLLDPSMRNSLPDLGVY